MTDAPTISLIELNTDADLQTRAEAAKAGCPVSKAEIKLTAKLVG